MSLAHSKECTWIRVVQHELYVFGFPLVIIGVTDRCGDAKSPIRMILYKWWSGVSIALEPIDKVLVGTVDEDWWRWRPDTLE